MEGGAGGFLFVHVMRDDVVVARSLGFGGWGGAEAACVGVGVRMGALLSGVVGLVVC